MVKKRGKSGVSTHDRTKKRQIHPSNSEGTLPLSRQHDQYQQAQEEQAQGGGQCQGQALTPTN
jgi:hypothetical protein